jgi:uncharacterized membrane protein
VGNFKSLHSKTLFFATVAILSNVLGNFALSQGMHQTKYMAWVSPFALLGVLSNIWVASGIGLLVIWMISQLSLLSWADLSYVLPVTAASYVLTAVLGAVALKEYVSTAHWIGIGLIFTGVVVVGRTAPRTAAIEVAEPQQ